MIRFSSRMATPRFAVVVTISLAIVAAAAAPPVVVAQGEVSMSVDEFNGFAWGTPAPELYARLGAPLQADTLPGEMVVLAYRDSLEGSASVAMYAMLGEVGLVKGQHSIPFDEMESTGGCEAQFVRLRKHLLLKYPMIVPEDRSRNNSPKAFCEAVLDGDAAWISTWLDPVSGARAMVVIDAGQPRLNVVFESAEFLAWVESRKSDPSSGP
ncbi:MAG: hypothetical protein M8865_09735 [marine benthic group bacterium]|nr:hypothetical protein [Gemmatimonadota bacterium]